MAALFCCIVGSTIPITFVGLLILDLREQTHRHRMDRLAAERESLIDSRREQTHTER